MTDIHSHIVWGVDDGPASIEESLSMLAAAAADGTAEMVATPHANSRFRFEREVVLERIALLTNTTGGRPKIHIGCEFHLSVDNFDHLMENLRKYTINAKQYLLVELPDCHVGPHCETVLRGLIDAGIVPIVVHPERIPVLRRNLARVENWVESGCLVQVTAASITGEFGRAARAASHRLLKEGLVHLVASDAHDAAIRHPGLGPARRAVSSGWGEDAAEILFCENPRAVVEGAPVPGGKQIAWQVPAHWYQFWKTGKIA